MELGTGVCNQLMCSHARAHARTRTRLHKNVIKNADGMHYYLLRCRTQEAAVYESAFILSFFSFVLFSRFLLLTHAQH